MKTFAELFPLGDMTLEAVAEIESMVDQALEDAARRAEVAGSPFQRLDGHVVVHVVHTSPAGDRLEMTAWRHAAARYRAVGWSVTFVTDGQGHPVMVVAP